MRSAVVYALILMRFTYSSCIECGMCAARGDGGGEPDPQSAVPGRIRHGNRMGKHIGNYRSPYLFEVSAEHTPQRAETRLWLIILHFLACSCELLSQSDFHDCQSHCMQYDKNAHRCSSYYPPQPLLTRGAVRTSPRLPVTSGSEVAPPAFDPCPLATRRGLQAALGSARGAAARSPRPRHHHAPS